MRLIDALEIPNAIAKNTECDEAKKVNHITAYVPKSLMTHWVDLWAKNTQWKRYEAALLSTGFIINEGCRDLFEKVMFENQRHVDGDFTPDHFPLFQAFQNRDRLLTNSGLFTSTYEGDYRQKANSLEIINWIERRELDVPNWLAERVRKFQSPETESSPAKFVVSDAPLDARERSTMLTLINAMAVRRPFNYNPNETRNGALKRIENATIDAGTELSDTTIRKYLKLATEEAELQKDKKI
ncbi:MAG: hypothetical protein COA47_04500 [Robiginitomaculum sp.]|nr:MAG: hypothetical protein COA47_04500 [Robiginitomaculum sp.]